MLSMSLPCTPSQVCGLEYPLLPSQTSTYLYGCFAVVVLVFLYGVHRKYSVYGLERRDLLHIVARVPGGVKKLIVEGLAQEKIIQRRFGGLMHSLMFYGILVLTVGTTLVGIDYDILRTRGMMLLQGNFYLGFKFSLDLFGVLFILGVCLALIRRLSLKPFFLNEDRADRLLLVGMLYLGVSGFLQEGLRFALVPVSWANFAPVGSALSSVFSILGAGPSSTFTRSWTSLYQVLWWIHALVAFALIASIPYTKYFHVPNALLNMLVTNKERPAGRLSTPINYAEITKKMESNPDFVPDVDIGLRTTDSLKWPERLMLDSCTNCGRCEAACPANAAGRDLSPRSLVQDLKSRFYKDYSQARDFGAKAVNLFESRTVRDGEAFSCVSCGACVYECPVDINQLDFIIDLRRSIVSDGRLDKKQSTMLSNLASSQNPYGQANSKRADWAKGLNVNTLAANPNAEDLLWVGCVGSFNQRSQSVVKSLVKIMQAAGVSFAILGSEEACSGDPARRLGEEGLYQQLAVENISKLNKYTVRKIVTTCPHCFNTIRNEYGVLGGNYEVIHHTQLLSDLIQEGKVTLSRTTTEKVSVTLHDACYAARYNNIFDEPRKLLEQAGQELKEMKRCGNRTFCCGAGGSNYWYDMPQQRSIAGIRTQEAKDTGASTLVTECPFCLVMFEDRAKTSESSLSVKDIAEIVGEELSQSKSPSG